MSKHEFQTEVNQLLDLVINSLYSNKEIFLRELVSNASDALDKLKFLTVSDDAYKGVEFAPKIQIQFDEEDRKTLTISDTGIGMNDEDMVEHIGTIAKSGTKNFLANLTGDSKKDSNLIGQFGVGFYSAFMVADKIEVISKKAGEEKAYKWVSDGKTGYEISDSQRDGHGTTIIMHLKEEGKEFANRWTLESNIKKYSNHIPFPIHLEYNETEKDEEGKDKGKVLKNDQVNSASALWTRSKSELKKDDYNEFYKTIGHDMDEPMAYVHTQAEGTLEYTTLFYIPKKAPMDLYRVDYQPGVKLYINRVFITDDEKELLPTYLRFVKGIIDSSDLPLNVSREILQHNKVLANIQSASVKKILGEIKKLSKDKEKYAEFWAEFGRPIKEGIYQDHANKDELLKLARFKSSKEEGLVSLEEYKGRMSSEQTAIYYITGENENVLKNSPLLEAYKAKEIEVLILDDEIDEIIIPSVTEFDGTPLKSVNRTDTADDLKTEKDEEKEKEATPVVEKIKKALGEDVKDVKVSSRLSESPSCVVADENDPTMQMQQMMKAMGQEMGAMGDIKPILEINPTHEIVTKLKDTDDEAKIEDVSRLLLDQALLIEGKELADPTEFAKRLNRVLSQSL
ncbi:MAG: molecular chaperone HtpG [Campylobacterales bacterium]|nr:molecular chaperone HtpG [Campylobacterales bacterium]